jgi:hypothetical protein
MPDFEVRTNVDEVIRTLQRYQVRLADIVQPPLDRGAAAVLGGMKPYPAPPPGSRYVRGAPPHSEKLGSRWTSRQIRGADYVGREVGNNASYAPWVQAAQVQARVHQERWQTDEQVITRELPAIAADVEQSLIRAADQAGG